jgi:hypothetical protein
MWIILGNKVQTQRVPDGRKVERQCTACGETAMFYEREVSKSFRLYFVSLFNYETQRVMACGACGAHYATDELGRPLSSNTPADERQKGTVLGSMKDAFRRVSGQAPAKEAATPPAPEVDGEPAKKTIQPQAKRTGSSFEDDDRSDDELIDPLADADDDLNARFAALEKRLAQGRSAQKPLK